MSPLYSAFGRRLSLGNEATTCPSEISLPEPPRYRQLAYLNRDDVPYYWAQSDICEG